MSEGAPVVADAVPDSSHLADLVERARILAREYYALTGRPLGVTGEIGEHEAVRLLGLDLAPVREKGFDAVNSATGRRFQIKTRWLPAGSSPSQRVGSIKIDAPWDAVLLVLLRDDLTASAIWEADRPGVVAALTAPGSKARNERGALAVSKFKSVGRLVWPVVGA